MSILECRNLTKIYDSYKKARSIRVLNKISFQVEVEDFLGIMGPSGSGKTTLVNILSGIDDATNGDVFINNNNISKMKKDELALFRRKNVGFIFQDFNLLDSLTIKENIEFPLILNKAKSSKIDSRVEELLEFLNIKDIQNSYPYNISGGQKQKTAIARAIAPKPSVIFADEPTGNLDSKSSMDVMTTFKKINVENASTIIMVTHDPFAASFCKKIIFIKDGQIKVEINSNGNRKTFFDKVIETQGIIEGEL